MDFECHSLKISLDYPCNTICDSLNWVNVFPLCATCGSRILYQKLNVVFHVFN